MAVRNLSINKPVLQDDPLTRKIIACAIEVHRRLGPGLLEKLYKEAMVIELAMNGLKVDKECQSPG